MALIGKRVMIVRGSQRYRWGTVIHADHDSFHMVDADGHDVYDRIENIIRAKEVADGRTT